MQTASTNKPLHVQAIERSKAKPASANQRCGLSFLKPCMKAAIANRLQASAALTKEGFTENQHTFQRTADLRYFGQAFEVRVAVTQGPVDAVMFAQVAQRFHA